MNSQNTIEEIESMTKIFSKEKSPHSDNFPGDSTKWLKNTISSRK